MFQRQKYFKNPSTALRIYWNDKLKLKIGQLTSMLKKEYRRGDTNIKKMTLKK